MSLVPEFSWAVGGKRVQHDMSAREAVLRTEGEPREIGSCLDVPAREARVSETRDRPSETTAKLPKQLPGGLARRPDAAPGRVFSLVGHLGSALSLSRGEERW